MFLTFFYMGYVADFLTEYSLHKCFESTKLIIFKADLSDYSR